MTAQPSEDSIMQDDNPLWYDYVETDEAPSRALIVSAHFFNVIIEGTKAIGRAYLLPDKIWCRASCFLARHLPIKAR